MIINEEMLTMFNACEDAKYEFAIRFPDGFDIGDLWTGKRSEKWLEILTDNFLKKYVGWGIGEGILPSRILANLREANLREANLREANLREANLWRANYNEYTIWPNGFDLEGLK